MRITTTNASRPNDPLFLMNLPETAKGVYRPTQHKAAFHGQALLLSRGIKVHLARVHPLDPCRDRSS